MRVSVLRFTVLAAALLVLGSATGTARSHAASASAAVRVNQVGYPTGAAKRAYLMSSVAETGARFAVKNSTAMMPNKKVTTCFISLFLSIFHGRYAPA